MIILNFKDNKKIEKKIKKRKLLDDIRNIFNILNYAKKYKFIKLVNKLLSKEKLFEYNVVILLIKIISYIKPKVYKKYFTYIKYGNF